MTVENVKNSLSNARKMADGEDKKLEISIALSDAEFFGYNDYGSGVYTPPADFRDEPDLLASWKEGQKSARKDAMNPEYD
ncbi:hypothetical protein JAB4_059500 (plasmid) [Janthinobacterium sp. HH102]|uniref:hypothetical protein n=1 Tax=Janthinobacterium sp. HH102 TaxID=1537274 RepID=UPI000893D8FE|nr:hypothetical protein [Janthinobacterium sp. HH102]QOU76450.1 hypothetical protein JAB4_059500 [Janthinobacterium sp. HH102]